MVPLLLAVLFPAVGRALAADKIPVILSTDVGNEIDDQWAVAYMLVNPQFQVLGIISAHAPTLPPPAAHYTYRVLRDEVENRLKMTTHPPLFEGSSLPLQDARTPRPNAGVDFIIQSSKDFSSTNRLTVLTIGAATDAASAIIEDPSITNRIRIVAMGFRSWPNGGEEFNVANDVAAWQAILRSDVPVVVGCGDVCRANLSLTLEQAKNLISEHGPVGAWLWDEFQSWYYRFLKPMRTNDLSKPWVIWDTVVLAYAEGLTTQEAYPRPVPKDDMNFAPGEAGKTITWVTGIDSARMWPDFIQKLDAYQRTHRVEDSGPPPFLP
ncbi:MAG TPA: nucleoside hydrolase [Terriglobia bacterium]|nr:nucleoside hydrolase [Terriglobia bacterium]